MIDEIRFLLDDLSMSFLHDRTALQKVEEKTSIGCGPAQDVLRSSHFDRARS